MWGVLQAGSSLHVYTGLHEQCKLGRRPSRKVMACACCEASACQAQGTFTWLLSCQK